MKVLSISRIPQNDARLLSKEFGKEEELAEEATASSEYVVGLTGTAKIVKMFTSRNKKLKITRHTYYLCASSKIAAIDLWTQMCTGRRCKWKFLELPLEI